MDNIWIIPRRSVKIEHGMDFEFNTQLLGKDTVNDDAEINRIPLNIDKVRELARFLAIHMVIVYFLETVVNLYNCRKLNYLGLI